MSRVVVLGSVNVDMVVRGPRLPSPGETVLGGEFYQAAGGKGANQAVAAARAARRPVAFIAAVGDDEYGRQALENFRRENLSVDFIKTVPGASTGIALIMVDAGGENQISVASGANAFLAAADIDALPDEVFTPGGVFLTCLESPAETVARGLQRAKQAGMTTVLNPAPANLRTLKLAPWVDVLTPNEGEAEALAGFIGEINLTAEASARQLQRRGFKKCVITLGPQGCLVVEEQATKIPGASVKAVDATGAGDAFNGALAAALAEGQTLVEAARRANRAAAIAVTRRGAQPSLPSRAEIEQFTEG